MKGSWLMTGRQWFEVEELAKDWIRMKYFIYEWNLDVGMLFNIWVIFYVDVSFTMLIVSAMNIRLFDYKWQQLLTGFKQIA